MPNAPESARFRSIAQLAERAMEISAQSIQTVGGQSGPLQSFVAALKPGDSLTAQVLGRSPAGLALVALAGKPVQLPLPHTLLPGTVLTLTVQQGTNGPAIRRRAAEADRPGQAARCRPHPPPPQATAQLNAGHSPTPTAAAPAPPRHHDRHAASRSNPAASLPPRRVPPAPGAGPAASGRMPRRCRRSSMPAPACRFRRR